MHFIKKQCSIYNTHKKMGGYHDKIEFFEIYPLK